MALTRRTLLQRIGLSLTALGCSDTVLWHLADRYQAALAQPTRRKIALLVGINQYPEQVCDFVSPRGEALNGCLTDIELQQELLIHRFGFHPNDILVLTNQAATRQNIVDAFQAHLIDRTRAGDIVLFHFSGLGSQSDLTTLNYQPANTTLDSPISNPLDHTIDNPLGNLTEPLTQPLLLTNLLTNSLVPIDSNLPTPENPFLKDLTTTTLGLLLRSLPTDHVTTVLDFCCTNLGQVLQGNLRIRSRPNAPSGQIHPAELELQAQLSHKSSISPAQIASEWQAGQLPGTLFSASQNQQIAAEVQWNGFSAGLFTYALTQQLWLTIPAPTIQIDFGRSIATVKQTAGLEQQPTLTGQTAKSATAYVPNPLIPASADGVITGVEEEGQVARIWLGGLSPFVAEYAGNIRLELLETAEKLQVRSREGLWIKAVKVAATPMSPPLQAGQFVQEILRVLPRNLGLTVALDNTLERIERVDATSAFSANYKIACVKAGEQSADFIFGKVRSSPETVTASLAVNRPSATAMHGYGLFSLGRNAIVSSLAQTDEAVKTAVSRLGPQLRSLLAMKLLRLTENQGSSRLGIQVTLEMNAPQMKVITQQRTVRAPWQLPPTTLVKEGGQNEPFILPLGSQIQYRLQNYSDQQRYFLLLGFDPQGTPIALIPLTEQTQDWGSLPAQTTLTIPVSHANLDWRVQAPTGLAETYLIFSRSPFTQAYKLLVSSGQQTDFRPVHPIANPLDVVQAVLEDLHQASLMTTQKTDIAPDSYVLDVQAWATFSFVYQVVEA